mgnify:CR=1 FL=1
MLRRPTEKAVRACFLQREERWIAWSDDVPGALTQGKTLDEARENRKDAIRLMLEPVDEAKLPERAGRLVEELIVL